MDYIVRFLLRGAAAFILNLLANYLQLMTSSQALNHVDRDDRVANQHIAFLPDLCSTLLLTGVSERPTETFCTYVHNEEGSYCLA